MVRFSVTQWDWVGRMPETNSCPDWLKSEQVNGGKSDMTVSPSTPSGCGREDHQCFLQLFTVNCSWFACENSNSMGLERWPCRAPTAPTENPGSIPSTHMAAENHLKLQCQENSSSRGIRQPLLTSAALHDTGAQTCMQTVH